MLVSVNHRINYFWPNTNKLNTCKEMKGKPLTHIMQFFPQTNKETWQNMA